MKMTKKYHKCDDTCKVHKTSKKIDKVIKKTKPVKITIKNKLISSVYSQDYSLIDDTINDITKMSRKVCVNDYAGNNVYLILQDALKKITLAEK